MLGYDRTRQCERYIDRRRFCHDRATPCAPTRPETRCVPEKDDEHAMVS
jgi:hypothetical protein